MPLCASLLPVFAELGEHAAVRRVAEPAIGRVSQKLFLAIPDRLRPLNPPQTLEIRGGADEQVVKFAKGGTDSSVVSRLAPAGETLLRCSEEPNPGLVELRTHRYLLNFERKPSRIRSGRVSALVESHGSP